ncbi:MAG: hypothetical protein ACKV1O_17825 [Saprospiraceae bacterium]
MSTSKQFMLGNVKTLHGDRVQPSVGIHSNNVVAVYRNSVAVSSSLYYKRGTISNDAVLTWGNEASLGNDSGETPTVAINNQNVIIEIHESDSSTSTNFWTHVGLLDPQDTGKINWGDSQNTGHGGSMPSVSLAYLNNQNVAIVAFSGGSSSENIYFMVGTVDSATKQVIKWKKLSEAMVGAYKPKISMNNNGLIVMAYEAGTSINVIYGQLSMPVNLDTTTPTITWTPGRVYIDLASYPDISLTDDGYVALAYQGESINYSEPAKLKSRNLYYPTKTRSGYLSRNGNLLDLDLNDAAYGPGLGKKPSIATNGSVVVMLQETPDIITDGVTFNDSKVLYASSIVLEIWSERNNWMSNYQHRSLSQLCLPGAHDAGMSVVNFCTNLATPVDTQDTQTQSKGFYEMLNCGIRYFDVRPGWLHSNDTGADVVYTGHFSDAPVVGLVGCLGLLMSSIFEDVDSFLSDNPSSEVVILKFSHYLEQIDVNNRINNCYAFNPDDPDSVSRFNPLIKALIIDLTNYFGPDGKNWLYINPNKNHRITDYTLAGITNGRSKIIAVFDHVDFNTMFSNDDAPDSATIILNNQVRASVYSYADYYIKNTPPPYIYNYDLVVYDNYSNTHDIEVMTRSGTPDDANHPGQPYLYLNASNHLADLFLLSWTLTQQIEDTIAGTPTIHNLAKQANCCLGSYIQKFIQDGNITQSNLPQIIYVDFCDNFVTDICNFINAFLDVR